MTDKFCDHYGGQGHCDSCDLPVDDYGNTEDSFQFCSFPDCGCDGERLCMAGESSAAAKSYNVEGMYSRSDKEAVKAKMGLYGMVMERKNGR